MKCACGEKVVYGSLCKKHFIEDVEKRVFSTIKKYGMILPGEKICVAMSGGKDSQTVAYLVKKYCKTIQDNSSKNPTTTFASASSPVTLEQNRSLSEGNRSTAPDEPLPQDNAQNIAGRDDAQDTPAHHHRLAHKTTDEPGATPVRDNPPSPIAHRQECARDIGDGAVEALAIDEGIAGYREKTIEDLTAFCSKYNIPLIIKSFKDEMGKTLDAILKKHKLKPCTACGTMRRYLLNKYSKNYDKIATGHNLDDEAQAIMMNMIKNQQDIAARIGPVTGLTTHRGFTPRIKPLYFIKEKEVMVYTLLKGFTARFTECPNAHLSFRNDVRDLLNDLEAEKDGVKLQLVSSFLDMLPSLKNKFKGEEPQYCSVCGEPSSQQVCNACKLAAVVGEECHTS